MIGIRREQAQRFLLMKNGLLGANGLRGKDGVLAYIRQAGCVQFDPIDICGRSHELSLLARVKGFARDMLDEMLYQDRSLIDFFDKNMCILPVEDWPCLGFLRHAFLQKTRQRQPVEEAAVQVASLMRERGTLSAEDLNAQPQWPWGSSALGRAALDTLFFRGDAVIHHKTGEIRHYALASDCLPRTLLDMPGPFQNERERQMWQVVRRIGAVGMLWNASSDAWLGVDGLNAQTRNEIFVSLARMGVIMPVAVEGLSQPVFILGEDLPLLQRCQMPLPADRRVRLLPPLDCMLWDRRLIYELFGFSYKWEIYTPEEQRRYGCYVLPVLLGEGFAGRVEPVCDRAGDALVVKKFWPETGVRVNDRFLWALEDALRELARFNGVSHLVWQEGWLDG